MSVYYFDTLKRSLAKPPVDREGLRHLVQETQFFFGVLRVKLESKDPAMRKEAERELAELKQLLEKRVS